MRYRLPTALAFVLAVQCQAAVGASLNEQLFTAASDGHAEAIAALHAVGADPNARSDDGSTPLHAAAENGHIVPTELERGVQEMLKAHAGGAGGGSVLLSGSYPSELDTKDAVAGGKKHLVSPSASVEQAGSEGQVSLPRAVRQFGDNIVVVHMTGSIKGDTIDFAHVARAVLENYEDRFDFMFLASNLPNIGHNLKYRYYGTYMHVRNQVRGLGLERGLFVDSFGSGATGRLKGVLHFPYRSGVVYGPGLHEIMHAWANFAVPTAEGGHWGFSSANGQLGGFDIADLVSHGNGRYSAGSFGTFANGGNRVPYSPIELYFAGLIGPEEVPDLWVARDGRWTEDRDANGNYIFHTSRVETYGIDRIIAEHGARSPDHRQSQKRFRAAMVLLVDDEFPVDADELNALSESIEKFARKGDNGTGSYNFWEATGGRATLRMDGLEMVTVTPGPELALVPAAGSLRQGLVRVINRSDRAGTVRVRAFDDAGMEYSAETLALGVGEGRGFTSRDLEEGNEAKGFTGTGAGTGDWRLVFETDLDIQVLGYVRNPDGSLATLHDTAPESRARSAVAFFNPASAGGLASRLRLANRSTLPATVTITGIDDGGQAGEGETSLTIPPRAARTLTAQQLEQGDPDLSGRLGDGRGKWRLEVASDRPLAVMSLLRTLEGNLTNVSTVPASAAGDVRLALVPAAGSLRQGLVRVINRSDRAGTVRVRAFDDAGKEYPPQTLVLRAGQGRRFTSRDLEEGNEALGFAGTRAGTGDWRLVFETDLDIQVLGYVRNPGGSLAALHDTAPESEGTHEVAFFNPASNRGRASALRLINPGRCAADIVIDGLDARGDAPPSGEVRLSLRAGAARTLTAQQLEQGDPELSGRLGDGEGKWQLFVSSRAPIQVMNLMRTRSGHLSNLSGTTVPGVIPEPPRRTGTPRQAAMLYQAAREGDVEAIEALLAAGADPEARHDYGEYTPLHMAAEGGHVEAIEALIKAGAVVHAKDLWYRTPLDLARARRHAAAVAVLKAAGRCVYPDTLHRAALDGDIEAIETLLATGVDPNARGDRGMSPLHFAARRGYLGVIETLLAAGADPNARGDGGKTPLHEAARGRRVEALKALLAAGANVNARDDNDSSPLFLAIFNGSVEAVKALIQAGADLNSQDHWGRTPLHMAAWHNYVGIIKVLLAAGADVNVRDSEGRTPLDIARVQGYAEAVALLEAAGR